MTTRVHRPAWTRVEFYGGMFDGGVLVVQLLQDTEGPAYFGIQSGDREHLYQLYRFPRETFVVIARDDYAGPVPERFANAHFFETRMNPRC